MKVVLITGCSSGIGYLSAITFARKGYKVYATMRNVQGAKDLVAARNRENLNLEIVSMDVSKSESVTKAVSKILDNESKIDVLVNNAGIGCLGTVEFMDENVLRDAFETNFYGVLRTTRTVLPTMRENRSGVIVNVSSIDGRIPGRPINWGYSATKHSLAIMSEALALEVEPFGIRVKLVEPGFFETNISKNRQKHEKELAIEHVDNSPYSEIEKVVKKAIRNSIQDAGDPQDVADIILQVSEEESYYPIHYPVGEDAVMMVEKLNSLTEVELIEDWKRTLQ